MKKKKWNKILAVLLAMVTAVSLLSGCGGKSAEKEDAETITVYLWSTKLYEKYAPYIQEQQDRQLLMGRKRGRRPHTDAEREHPDGRPDEDLDGKTQ